MGSEMETSWIFDTNPNNYCIDKSYVPEKEIQSFINRIFNCQQWVLDQEIGDNAIGFCVAEKFLLILSIIIGILLCQ